MEFEPDVDRLIARAFEIIDAKREALGLAEYNPNRFGQSGDALMEEALRATQNKPTLGFYSISDVSAE